MNGHAEVLRRRDDRCKAENHRHGIPMIESVDEDVVIANGMMLASVQLRGNLDQSFHSDVELGFLATGFSLSVFRGQISR